MSFGHDLRRAKANDRLAMLGEAKTNAEVGATLYLSVPTMKTHISRILTKLDLTTASRSRCSPTTRAFSTTEAGRPFAPRPDLTPEEHLGGRHLQLYEGVDQNGAGRAVDALEQLAALVTVLDDLGPVARRAVSGRLRRARTAEST